MASASTITTPAALKPVPDPVAKATLIHTFLEDLSKAETQFKAFGAALTSGAAFTGPLAGLQAIRADILEAYQVFLLVENLIKQVAALPLVTPVASAIDSPEV